MVLECPYVCGPHVPSGFTGRAGSNMSTGWDFFWGMPGWLPWRMWVGSREGWGAEDGAQVGLGHLPGLLVTTALTGGGARAAASCKTWLLPGHAGCHCLGGVQGWSYSLIQAGRCTGAVFTGQPGHQALFNLLLLHWDCKSSCMSVSVFYSPPVNPTGFQNPAKGSLWC